MQTTNGRGIIEGKFEWKERKESRGKFDAVGKKGKGAEGKNHLSNETGSRNEGQLKR